MYVYVCFDVEDLVDPDSDEPPLDIAEMLSAEGIVASLCVVGEKARLWERRGRSDVIAAVKRHDVSLHTDHHSLHPTVAEYLADKGWSDGVAEAMRQEGPGVRDLTRLFGASPTSWGTSGASWGPQIPAATRRLGIPSNIYSHARAGETGACWFAGQLCFSDWIHLPGGEDALCDDTAFETSLPALLQELNEAARRGTQCLGLFAAHPTRLRHTVFWDALNFAEGRNPDPADYRLAPRRDFQTYARGLANLRRMILAVRDLPEVHIVGVGSLNGRFAPNEGSLSREELRQLARNIAESGVVSAEEPLASPAQTLDALARAVLHLAEGGTLPERLTLSPVLGPLDLAPALERPVTVSAKEGLALAREVVRQLRATNHLPTALPVQGLLIGPGPLLRAAAAAFLALERGHEPTQVTLPTGMEEPAQAAMLAQEAIHRRLPGWPPHPRDLRLDQLALHTRLQSWSLKPATLTV